MFKEGDLVIRKESSFIPSNYPEDTEVHVVKKVLKEFRNMDYFVIESLSSKYPTTSCMRYFKKLRNFNLS